MSEHQDELSPQRGVASTLERGSANGARVTVIETVRKVWKNVVPYGVRRQVHRLLNALRRPVEEIAADQDNHFPQRDEIVRGGVLVSGFLSDINGIGRAGRLTAEAVSGWDANSVLHDLREERKGTTSADLAVPGGIWLCHCNPPEALYFMAHGDRRVWKSRYRIGYWAYELQQLPDDWVPAIEHFHEIWVPSEFVAGAVRRACADPAKIIRVVPHPLPDVSHVALDRKRFGTDDTFAFLCMFDTLSTAARKNPFGAIRAFQRAFSPAERRVSLAVKVVNANEDAATMVELRRLVAGWPSIAILTDHLSDNDTLSLIASVDCLVSLYRSEGFGLTIAEAMLLKVAVIATDWSAPVEFCRGGAELIPAKLVPVEDVSGAYQIADRVWANPDTDTAAVAMLRLFNSPQYRAELVAAGARLVRERLGSSIEQAGYEDLLTPARPLHRTFPFIPRSTTRA